MNKEFKDILFEISTVLKDAGIINHLAEVRSLAAKVLDRPANQIHPIMNIDLSEEQLSELNELASQRANGKPLQLITGQTGFHNCLLYCEKDVFIPRNETEILVNRALYYLDEVPIDVRARILELGTGTGAITIALAASDPRHQYYGVDISEKCVELAQRNAELNQVYDKSAFFKGNYFDVVRGWEDITFELIVSNPPYIKSGDIKSLDSEVKNWDPGTALDGGEDGLDHYRLISSELTTFLDDNGYGLFEIDPEYVDKLKDIFKNDGLHIEEVVKDLDQNDRVIVVKKG